MCSEGQQAEPRHPASRHSKQRQAAGSLDTAAEQRPNHQPQEGTQERLQAYVSRQTPFTERVEAARLDQPSPASSRNAITIACPALKVVCRFGNTPEAATTSRVILGSASPRTPHSPHPIAPVAPPGTDVKLNDSHPHSRRPHQRHPQGRYLVPPAPHLHPCHGPSCPRAGRLPRLWPHRNR